MVKDCNFRKTVRLQWKKISEWYINKWKDILCSVFQRTWDVKIWLIPKVRLIDSVKSLQCHCLYFNILIIRTTLKFVSNHENSEYCNHLVKCCRNSFTSDYTTKIQHQNNADSWHKTEIKDKGNNIESPEAHTYSHNL